MTASIVWAALILAGLAYEAYTLATKVSGDTLSERTRALFRVHTSKPGRAIFLVVWSAFSVWFGVHILTSAV